MSRPARKRAQAIARGRGRDARLVIPFAFEVAARISARSVDEFLTDPTQLANSLAELHRAIDADGVLCADARGMELESAESAGLDVDRIVTNGRVGASLEACRRLRVTMGDNAALLAALSGPATLENQFGVSLTEASDAFTAIVRSFCDAGADGIIVMETVRPADGEGWEEGLITAKNIASFYNAMMYLWEVDGPAANPVRTPLNAPQKDGVGLIMTQELVAADYDIEALRQWVAGSK